MSIANLCKKGVISLHTVLEVSKMLGTSKATIYRKLENIDSIKSHIKIKNNIRYIDDAGVELIKTVLSSKENLSQNPKLDSKDMQNTKENSKQNTKNKTYLKSQIKDVNVKRENDLLIKHEKYIENLEDEIEYLRNEMQTKNRLLEEQSRQLANSQILLMEKKKMPVESDIAADKEIGIEELKLNIESNSDKLVNIESDETEKKSPLKPLSFLKRVLNKNTCP